MGAGEVTVASVEGWAMLLKGLEFATVAIGRDISHGIALRVSVFTCCGIRTL